MCDSSEKQSREKLFLEYFSVSIEKEREHEAGETFSLGCIPLSSSSPLSRSYPYQEYIHEEWISNIWWGLSRSVQYFPQTSPFNTIGQYHSPYSTFSSNSFLSSFPTFNSMIHFIKCYVLIS